jgi:hypothetical protein
MGLRPAYDKDMTKEAYETFNKWAGRTYFLWLCGVGVGIVKLKAEKVSFSGVEYTISNPEIIQGLIFVGVLVCYVASIGMDLINNLQWTIPNRALARRMIYLASRPRRTFQNKTTKELRAIRKRARRLYMATILFFFAVTLLPLAHILIFERGPLWIAIKAMF